MCGWWYPPNTRKKSFRTFHLQGKEDQQPCEQPCDFHMEHPGNVSCAAVVQSWVHQGSQFPPSPSNRQRNYISYAVEFLLTDPLVSRQPYLQPPSQTSFSSAPIHNLYFYILVGGQLQFWTPFSLSRNFRLRELPLYTFLPSIIRKAKPGQNGI